MVTCCTQEKFFRVILALLCFFPLSAEAQTFRFDHLIEIDAETIFDSKTTYTETDEQGNVYMAGKFAGTLQVGAGDVFSGESSRYVYVMKFETESTLAYYNMLGIYPSEADIDIHDMAVDGEGNVFLLIDAKPGAGISYLDVYEKNSNIYNPTEFSTRTTFLLKYSSDGTLTPESPRMLEDIPESASLAFDHQNQLYIAGRTEIDEIYSMKYHATDLSPIEESKVLLVKLMLQDSEDYVTVGKLKVDRQGNIILAGEFEGEISIGNDVATFQSNQKNLYVVKYHQENQSFLQTRVQTNETVSLKDLAVDEENHIYITGNYKKSLTFNENTTLQAQEGQEIYVAKYNDQLLLAYAYPINGSGFDEARGIAVNEYFFYLTGHIAKEADFDLKEGKKNLNAGNNEIFIAKYQKANAGYEEAVLLKSETTGGNKNRGNNIRVHTAANNAIEVLVAGYYDKDVLFDPPDGAIIHGNEDIFLARYEDISPVISNINPTLITVDDPITLTGMHLKSEETKVLIDGNTIADELVTVNDAGTSISFTVPATLTAGEHTVTVTVNGKQATSTEALKFTLEMEDIPIITHLDTLLASAGDAITITGEHLKSDHTQVLIDDQALPDDIVSVDAAGTSITFTVPATLAIGKHTVKVTVDGNPATGSLDFTVVAPPVPTPEITTISPLEIAVGQQATIVITGQHLQSTQTDGTKVYLNNILFMGALTVSETQISFTVPDNLPVGDYTVTVKVDDIQAISTEPLTFIVKSPPEGAPQITAIAPSETTAGQAVAVTITGKHLQPTQTNGTVVHIDNVVFTGSIAVTETGITFTIPDTLSVGVHTLTVTVDGEPATGSVLFTVNPDRSAPSVQHESPAHTNEGAAVNISAIIADPESGIEKAEIRYSGITQTLGNPVPLPNTGGTTYTLSVPASAFDKLGLQYEIKAENKEGLDSIVAGKVYLQYHLESTALYAIQQEAPAQKHYRIIAMPFKKQPVTEAWQGGITDSTYNQRNFRLFRSKNNQYQEYLQGDFTDFTLGEGYMYIQKKSDFNVQGLIDAERLLDAGGGLYVEIPVQPGNNLIGNPFPFAIDWETVKQANAEIIADFQGDLSLKGYEEGPILKSALQAYEGGLVRYNGDGEVKLKIPVSAGNAENIRMAGTANKKATSVNPLDNPSWQVNLDLEGEELVYRIAGFGMHPAARQAEDHWDDYAFPRLTEYLELNFNNPLMPGDLVARDIVPTAEAYTWEVEVVSNLSPQSMQLTWDNSFFGQNDKQLMLLDLQNNQWVDMRKQQTYPFHLGNGSRSFKIFFGTQETIAPHRVPDRNSVGTPFPNPAAHDLAFPISLAGFQQLYQIEVAIYNATGDLVASFSQRQTSGFHQIGWNRQDQRGTILPAGLYFYRIQIAGDLKPYTGKIVLQ